MFDVVTYALSRGYTNAAISQAGGGTKEIEIETISGIIPPDVLAELLKTPNTTIKIEDKCFRLSRVEGDTYKYMSAYTNGAGQIINMTELDINKNTGEFNSKPIIFEGSSVEYLEEMLQEHINDNNIHVSSADRAYWNNKVSAEAIEIPQGEYDYRLHLKK